MERKSSIELLRIISFLMVVILHISPIGLVVANPINPGTFSSYFCLLTRIFVTGAVMIFVAIGGYVSFYGNFDTKKSLKKLFIPLLMYLPFFMQITYKNYHPDSFRLFLSINSEHFFTVYGTYYHLWFIFVYFVTLILFKYIRVGIDKFSKKENLFFILFLLVISSINTFYPLINIQIFNDYFFNYLLSFISIYACGYYINKYDVKVNKKLCIFILFIIYVLYSFFFRVISHQEEKLFFDFMNTNNLFNKLLGVFWLLLFKDINIKSKLINSISSLTYGGYICHVIFITILMKYIDLYQYFNHKYYVLIMGVIIILVALLSLLLEWLRKLVLKAFKLA